MGYRRLSLLIIFALVTMGEFSDATGREKMAKPLPCSSNFELELSVLPAVGTDALKPSAKIGVKFEFSSNPGRAVASRLHTKDTHSISNAQCLKWQKKYWPLVESIFIENTRAERADLICYNIGRIEYRIGGKARKTNVCLSDSHRDKVTYAFRYFYEGADALAMRYTK